MQVLHTGKRQLGQQRLVVTEGTRVLWTPGSPPAGCRRFFAPRASRSSEIDAVFVTHEHSDHSSGIESLKKFPHLKFFANAATARRSRKS